MDANSYLVMAGLIAVINALTKIIELTIKKVNSRRNGNGGEDNPHSNHFMLTNLYEIITKKDDEGRPLCYFPKSVIKELEAIRKILERTHGKLEE